MEDLIRRLSLEPHPEGGYFRETYRSELMIGQKVLPDHFTGDRACCTCIYFLLGSDTFSAFHRILQDEIWHFYRGNSILLHIIQPDGQQYSIPLGAEIEKGYFPQYVVPAGCWFAAEVNETDSYALVGCTVSPGFDFRDFELAERASLLEEFPEHRALITKFTRI